MKWPKFTSEFRVKVTYRRGKTRGVIALPAPILGAWDYPEYIEFLPGDDEGTAILRPVIMNDQKPQPKKENS